MKERKGLRSNFHCVVVTKTQSIAFNYTYTKCVNNSIRLEKLRNLESISSCASTVQRVYKLSEDAKPARHHRAKICLYKFEEKTAYKPIKIVIENFNLLKFSCGKNTRSTVIKPKSVTHPKMKNQTFKAHESSSMKNVRTASIKNNSRCMPIFVRTIHKLSQVFQTT